MEQPPAGRQPTVTDVGKTPGGQSFVRYGHAAPESDFSSGRLQEASSGKFGNRVGMPWLKEMPPHGAPILREAWGVLSSNSMAFLSTNVDRKFLSVCQGTIFGSWLPALLPRNWSSEIACQEESGKHITQDRHEKINAKADQRPDAGNLTTNDQQRSANAQAAHPHGEG